MLGHSDDVADPKPVMTGQKALFTDQGTGTAHLFHAVSLPGQPAMQSIQIHDTDGAKQQGTQTALRRAARWRISNESAELLGPDSVPEGVTGAGGAAR